jgi:flavin-dependent dehydrogenase
MPGILVVGGGPAGGAAALAALAEGVSVRVLERSRHPKHKVCGEFLSPEAILLLDRLGAGKDLAELKPACIRKCRLHFGLREKSWNLAEPALGLSRFELDKLLLEKAAAMGATVSHGECGVPDPPEAGSGRIVLASGRKGVASGPDRLFGFKAHYEGPVDDAVELFFARHGYVGVSPVENGWTNVCGIAPASALRRYGFDIDQYVAESDPLSERLRPLRRRMRWLIAGPLCLSTIPHPGRNERVYPAGDALGFIDPFTGSGILNALLTGSMAGRSAARGLPGADYSRKCQALLGQPFGISGLVRKLLARDCAYYLAALTPGRWLFRLTRVRTPELAGPD